MIVTLIAAVAQDGCLGKDGGLPWRLPSDLRRFRELTMWKPVIMGRRTWDSLPRKPLAGRFNVVLSRTPDAVAASSDDMVICRSMEEALEILDGEPEVAVIGGAEIYALALPYANRILLTEVAVTVPDGDAFFPELEPGRWRETSREPCPDLAPAAMYVTLTKETGPEPSL